MIPRVICQKCDGNGVKLNGHPCKFCGGTGVLELRMSSTMTEADKLALALDTLHNIANNLNAQEIDDQTKDPRKLFMYAFQLRVAKDKINAALATIEGGK